MKVQCLEGVEQETFNVFILKAEDEKCESCDWNKNNVCVTSILLHEI